MKKDRQDRDEGMGEKDCIQITRKIMGQRKGVETRLRSNACM